MLGSYVARRMSVPRVNAAVLSALLLALAGCAEPEPPAYTRLDGAAPEQVRARRGATLVVFWATWCGPCVDEAPSLVALARDPPTGISLLTVGEDETERPVREFFRGPPPVELGFRLDDEYALASAFGVEGLPVSFLVVDGRLVARFQGARDWSSRGMRRLLARLAAEGPGGSPPATGNRR
jgi:thiol-disulfide isomerase/thioredoxin